MLGEVNRRFNVSPNVDALLEALERADLEEEAVRAQAKREAEERMLGEGAVKREGERGVGGAGAGAGGARRGNASAGAGSKGKGKEKEGAGAGVGAKSRKKK